MMAGEGVNLVYAIGALVFMVAVLFSFRISLGSFARMALGWMAIFAVVIVLFSFRHEAEMLWSRVRAELTGEPQQQLVGSTVILRQGPDGHFWARVSVNGREFPFLVDSGATITAMNSKDAAAAGIDMQTGGLPVAIGTANGMVMANRATADRLDLQGIQADDFPIIVAEEFGDTNVIGMNFLSKLQSWRVEGRQMHLDPVDPDEI